MNAATTLVLFLSVDDSDIGWARIDGNGHVVGRGTTVEDMVADAAERTVAIVPAAAVMLHSVDLANLAPAQARAVARLVVAESSIAPIDGLHVALGRIVPGEKERLVAVADTALMIGWLAKLKALGFDPDALIPAPMLLPQPMEGYNRALINGETVIRARDGGWIDDPSVTQHLIGDAQPAVIAGAALDDAIAVAVADPALDLRQGAFAKRRRLHFDWPTLRRLLWIIAAVAGVTLLISMALIARYSFAADALDLRAENAARSGLSRGVAPTDPLRGLDVRLAGLRGGGLGFTTMAAVVFGAVQATPNVELAAVDFTPDGMMRVTVLAPGKPEADALLARIKAAGLSAEATPFQNDGGRIKGEFRVSSR